MFLSWWQHLLRRTFRTAPRTGRRRGSGQHHYQPGLEPLEDRRVLASLTATALAAGYGQLPLSFEANQGQTAAQVNFLAHGDGYGLFLTPGEAVLSLLKPAAPAAPPVQQDVLRLQLVGASPSAAVVGLDQQDGTSNYLIGNDPTQWHTHIANYGKVEYQNVYQGVNLVYYGNQRQLEYDFVVGPGADPGAIRLALQGATGMELDAQGNLVLHTTGGDVVEHAPVVYQDGAGSRQSVAGQYVLEDNGQVGFAVGAYDPARPLIIDPVLSYSTFLGGSGLDADTGIAVDGSGNAYVTGYTYSSDFPTMAGAFQTTLGGGEDAFVTKLNATGNALVYSTFLGGSSDDVGAGIAVDGSGNAYVTGETFSSNFPTTPNAFQTIGGGLEDAFVAKLNASGTALVYSTYLGGSGKNSANRLAVDGGGNAYVTGFTTSTNFPTTANAFQTTFGGGLEDAFVTKLNASGTALVYSTYLGGSGADLGAGIAVDGGGNAYVTGLTNSTDFPTTAGAFQTSFGGTYDAFVTKLNASGTALVYSTYLGGSGQTVGLRIAVDGSGNAYVTGWTIDTNFPTTAGAFQATLGGGEDAFVTKLNASGTALVYSTYLGGSGADLGAGIAVDGGGNAYVTSETESTNFPSTAGAFQTTLGGTGAQNAFVTRLNASGTALVYSTYLRGSGGDMGSGIAVDGSGNAYVTGSTQSSDFPTTAGAFQSYAGVGDAFIAKIGMPGFRLSAPQTALAGTTFTVTVTALDENGQQDTGYRGTIHLTSSDGSAVLPAEYTFTAGDNGEHAFQATLKSFGSQSITGIDTTGSITGTAAILVPQPPVAGFDWEMPQRFGLDRLTSNYSPFRGDISFTPGSDGLIDYPWEQSTVDPQHDPTIQGYVNPDHWTVILDASSTTGTGTLNYSWLFYTTNATGQTVPANVTNLQAIIGSPGRFTADFPSQGTYSVHLTVTDAYGQTDSKTRDVVVKDYLIVSIGDSIAAGEGAPDQPAVHDSAGFTKIGAHWEDPRANRSFYAGPAQAAIELQQAVAPHASVTFISVAATGAQVSYRGNPDDSNGGLLSGYSGIEPAQEPAFDYPPQIDQVQSIVNGRPIDALLISIGANDCHFSDIVTDLLLGVRSEADIGADFNGRLGDLVTNRYPALAAEISNTLHPKNVYITEYMDPLRAANGNFSDWPGSLGPYPNPTDLTAALGVLGLLGQLASVDIYHNYGITVAKEQWAYDNIIQPLNYAVQQAAAHFGWHFVGGIAADFAHHGYPAGNESWITTLEDSLWNQSDAIHPFDAKFGVVHPNALGYQDYARHIKQEVLQPDSIRGQLFEDLNGNGVRDQGEDHGLAGWAVYLDTNNNGILDLGEPTTVTDATGTYFFPQAPAGNYVVRAVPPDRSWFPTSSGTPHFFNNFLDDPQATPLTDLGFYHPASLSGTVFLDANRSGGRDSGEAGLAGRTVYLDLNGNGTLDAPQTAHRGASPHSSLNTALSLFSLDVHGVPGLLAGVSVSLNINGDQGLVLGVSLLSPAGLTVPLFNKGDGFSGTTPLVDFNGEDPNGTWTLEIDGQPYSDLLPGDREPRLESWSLALTSGDPSTQTDANGAYTFAVLRPGSYTVREVVPAGWTETAPAAGAQTVSLSSGGTVASVDFGVSPANTATLANSADSQAVTLTSPTGTTLADVQALPNPSPSDAPGGVQFPVGFFSFQVQGLTAGSSTSITLALPPGVTVNAYYRYGPTPENPTPHWYPFLFDGTTGAEIDNPAHRIILHFVDGGRGDDDLVADGVVADAGAPGLLIVPSPPAPVSAPIPVPAAPVSLYQRWVVRVWQDLFGLPANPGWVAIQVGRLEQGADPRRVVLAILRGADYRTREVQRLYRWLLHSAAGRRALALGLAFLAGGGTRQQLEAWLFASPAYFHKRAGGSGAGFLQALFHDVLGQGPDPRTVQALGGLLVDPSARWEAATIMLRSLPADVHWVADLYERFLHVWPDGKSLRLYVSRLERGVREEVVLADLLASPLYFARV
jgi:hypothetical protein